MAEERGMNLAEMNEIIGMITGQNPDHSSREDAVTDLVRQAIDLDLDGPIISCPFNSVYHRVDAKMGEMAQDWFEQSDIYDKAPAEYAPYLEDAIDQRRWSHEDRDGKEAYADYMRDMF